MKKILSLIVLSLLLISTGFAQKADGSLKGILKDSSDNQPVIAAVVSILRIADSTLVTFTMSTKTGGFEVKGLADGNYRVIISSRDSSTEEMFDPFFGLELMGVQEMMAAKLGLNPEKDFFRFEYRRQHYNIVGAKFHNAFRAAFRDAKQ